MALSVLIAVGAAAVVPATCQLRQAHHLSQSLAYRRWKTCSTRSHHSKTSSRLCWMPRWTSSKPNGAAAAIDEAALVRLGELSQHLILRGIQRRTSLPACRLWWPVQASATGRLSTITCAVAAIMDCAIADATFVSTFDSFGCRAAGHALWGPGAKLLGGHTVPRVARATSGLS